MSDNHARASRPTDGVAGGVPGRWGLATVVGASMEPTLHPGDRLLVSYRRTPVAGALVVARFPDGAVVVKRAVERRTDLAGRLGWWLLSDNPSAGVDSRHRGVISDAEVLAVVVGRLWPRPGRVA